YIGDPSGRTDMRQMMTPETIQHNCDCFKVQMSKFIEFGEGKGIMVNNADWLLQLNYIDMLREVGPHFSVNNMLRAECYKNRMEKGLSFLEFNYMVMQSYDFYHLYKELGCNMQLGGDDQWSNLLGGTDLIRRKTGANAFAMTIPLLTKADGTKMGKTAGGAVWLDPNKTSPFDFYQYWRNVDDADVVNFIKKLTFLSLEEIKPMESWEGAKLNEAKELLAYEMTSLVHSKEEADKAQEASRALFRGGVDSANMPTTELDSSKLVDGSIALDELMIEIGLAPTKSEVRRLVQQGGVSVNDSVADDCKMAITEADLRDGVTIKKGKKKFHKAIIK
ncbi:tyrosine--tRNA ligase, partial [Peptostreptococcus anaerobius]